MFWLAGTAIGAAVPLALPKQPAAASANSHMILIKKKKSKSKKTYRKSSKKKVVKKKSSRSTAKKRVKPAAADTIITGSLPRAGALVLPAAPLPMDPDLPLADADAIASLRPLGLRAPAGNLPQSAPEVLPPPQEEDRALIEACELEQATAGRAADACIGRIANSCADKAPAGGTADIVACIERERRVWAAQLVNSYQGLLARLDDAQARQIQDAQSAWDVFRARNCGFFETFYEGQMARPLSDYCLLRETARRSIELGSLLGQTKVPPGDLQ